MFITTEYKPEYREQVLELVSNFEKEFLVGFGMGINAEVFDGMIAAQKDSSFLLFVDGKLEGLLSGLIINAACIKTGLTWQEVVWYVNKEHRNSRCGIMLFKNACKALKAKGVETMIMAHLHNDMGDKMSRIYQRLGFRPFEHHYIRSL